MTMAATLLVPAIAQRYKYRKLRKLEIPELNRHLYCRTPFGSVIGTILAPILGSTHHNYPRLTLAVP